MIDFDDRSIVSHCVDRFGAWTLSIRAVYEKHPFDGLYASR